MGGVSRAKTWAVGLAVFSSVAFGASGPFGKALINSGFSPLQAVWLRITGAALIMVPVLVVLRGPTGLRVPRRALPQLLVYGITGVAGVQALYFVAAARLPVGVAILLEFMGPVVILVWIRLVRRQAVSRSAAAGVVVALVGLACVVQVWSGLRLDAVGLAAGFGAAVSQAAYFLLVDRLTGTLDPLAMTAAGSLIGALALTAVAAPWAMPWDVLAGSVSVGDRVAPGWALAGWIVLVSTVLAYWTGIAAVQRLSAPVAAGICYIEAVAATLIAWAVLGERLTVPQTIGGVIVLTGAFLAQRSATVRAGSEAVPPAVAVAADRPGAPAR